MRQTKMIEWMENVEKAISRYVKLNLILKSYFQKLKVIIEQNPYLFRIMADKVYTSAEFKRERDNFHVG